MSQPPKSAQDIFLAALDSEPDKPAALLDDLCAGDAALRRQVELLRQVHVFLPCPPSRVVAV